MGRGATSVCELMVKKKKIQHRSRKIFSLLDPSLDPFPMDSHVHVHELPLNWPPQDSSRFALTRRVFRRHAIKPCLGFRLLTSNERLGVYKWIPCQTVLHRASAFALGLRNLGLSRVCLSLFLEESTFSFNIFREII